jgi:predicted RNase H-like nuclease (RuvC/YqgF family)
VPVDLERRVAELQRELDAAHAKISSLEVRCAMLEGETNRHALERLRYIMHLEEGLAMLGASERSDLLPSLEDLEDRDDEAD